MDMIAPTMMIRQNLYYKLHSTGFIRYISSDLHNRIMYAIPDNQETDTADISE